MAVPAMNEFIPTSEKMQKMAEVGLAAKFEEEAHLLENEAQWLEEEASKLEKEAQRLAEEAQAAADKVKKGRTVPPTVTPTSRQYWFSFIFPVPTGKKQHDFPVGTQSKASSQWYSNATFTPQALRMGCLILLVTSVFAHSHGLENSAIDEMEDLQGKFVSFDKDGIDRKLWLQRYQEAKSQCLWDDDVHTLEYNYDWFPDDKTMRSSYWSYLASQMLITTYYPNLPRWFLRLFHFFFGAASYGPPLQSYNCVVPDAENGEFRIRRLGPFVGNGGFDWHKMRLEDPYNLRSVVEHGTIHVTGFTAMPVGEEGEILGLPPIHIHHGNLGENPHENSLARISQWHGDSQCTDSEGGTACYVTTLPYGFGFPASKELRLDIDFNDVRPPQSPDLHFWLETAIRVAKPPGGQPWHNIGTHDVGTVILGVPFRFNWFNSTADFQRLYFIPSDQPTALWVTGKMPVAGTFVKGKLETHQHMFDKALVFKNTSPEDLGLNSETWHLRKPWLPWNPRENGWTNDTAAMQALESDVNSHFTKLVHQCAKHVSCTKPPALVWTLNDTHFENGEEREMPWPKSTWTFEKDEQFTIVIYHKAMNVKKPTVELPQHLAITGHYLPKPGTLSNHVFILPSSHIEWARIDTVDWLSTLTHHGGQDMPDIVWSWPCAVAALCIIVVICTFTCCMIMVPKKIVAMVRNRANQHAAESDPVESDDEQQRSSWWMKRIASCQIKKKLVASVEACHEAIRLAMNERRKYFALYNPQEVREPESVVVEKTKIRPQSGGNREADESITEP